MKVNKLFLGLCIAGTILTSCSSDDTKEELEKKVVAPATYDFKDNNESTVSFGGQTTRIKMAQEFISALKITTNTEAQLDAMFAHEAGNNDFMDADLNASGKSMRSKVAASVDYFSSNSTEATKIKGDFDGWIKSQADDVFPNWTVDAVAGTAGKIQEAGGGSTRYVNAKGLELNQAIGKSLIGALIGDQILNSYLSTAVLDAGTNKADNDAGIKATGKNYTTMEHKWDEAYGYLYGAEETPATPVLGKDSFLNKYLKKVDGDDDFKGIAKTIYDAFKLGRAAIVAKNYTVRDAQAEIIRENISKVIAVRAVHYLQAGKGLLENNKGKAFHELSEGFGFVYSLRFTRAKASNGPGLPVVELNAFLALLMKDNGFWDVTPVNIDAISDRIASVYGFTKEQA